jgi:hypothetical protein
MEIVSVRMPACEVLRETAVKLKKQSHGEGETVILKFRRNGHSVSVQFSLPNFSLIALTFGNGE